MKSRLRISFPKLIICSIILAMIAKLPLLIQILQTRSSFDRLFSLISQYIVTWNGGGCGDGSGSHIGIGISNALCLEPAPRYYRTIAISDVFIWFLIFFVAGLFIMKVVNYNESNSSSKFNLVRNWSRKIYRINKFLFSIVVSLIASIFYSIVNVFLAAIPLLFYGFRDSYEPDMLFKTNCDLGGYGDSYTSCAIPTISTSDIVFSFIIWFIVSMVLFSALAKIATLNCKMARKNKN